MEAIQNNLKVVAIDIETIADPTCKSILPEIKPDSRLKDQKKIEENIKLKKQKQIYEMGLDPLTNLICCIGFYDGKNRYSISLTRDTHDAERELLMRFWVKAEEYSHFVTFNGREFDFRCILLHGVTHGIRPSINIDKGKYNRGNHTDLRQVLAGTSQFAKGKLDFFCKKFLGDQKTEGIDGEKVQSFFDMGLHDDIARYCEKDAKLTYELYKKCESAGLLE